MGNLGDDNGELGEMTTLLFPSPDLTFLSGRVSPFSGLVDQEQA